MCPGFSPRALLPPPDSLDFSRKREKSQRFLSDKFDFFSGIAIEYGREMQILLERYAYSEISGTFILI